jgi:hypothetical protein
MEMGVEVGSSTVPKNPAPPREEIGNVASSQWSNMSDEQILAHFGLDPSIASRAKQEASMDGSKLEQPVVDSNSWQFADEAPTVSIDRKDFVALNHGSYPPRVEPLELPEPVIVEERVTRRPAAAEPTTIEIDFQEPAEETEGSKKEFSTTDSEYEKMREIEKELLGF